MKGFTENERRNVIPRWRTFDETAKLGELEPSARQLQESLHSTSHDPLAQAKADWEKHRTIGHAADLVGAGIFLERSHEVQEAIEFLRYRESQTSIWVKELLEQFSSESEDDVSTIEPASIQQRAIRRVQNLRPLLRDEPKDPITQVDIAHAFYTLGNSESASEHMIVAQQLAPNNRFVLRSASCLWTNMEEYDRAYDALIRSDGAKSDPWLMSAEIAVGNELGKSPQSIKRALNLINDENLLDFHRSELASAVATVDWNHGSERRAKRLFDRSLKDPTENSLAQAVSVLSQDASFSLSEDLWDRPRVFEAKAQDAYLNEDWEHAVEHCLQWQADQPFSSGAGISGSFISSAALDDFELSKQFAQTGLVANPDNFSLLNNLAFSLINLNEFSAAEKYLSRINLSRISGVEHDVARILKSATTGLLHYRQGDVLAGRRNYLDARRLAGNLQAGFSNLEARATAFHAIEEAPHLSPNDHQIIDEAIDLLIRERDPACGFLLSKLRAIRDNK
ncbi:MAG: hypothetical protein OXJ55_03300 [Caldilineaceae bacterium]|nr:hypothetical protein [Caldilineaceae bacterium]